MTHSFEVESLEYFVARFGIGFPAPFQVGLDIEIEEQADQRDTINNDRISEETGEIALVVQADADVSDDQNKLNLISIELIRLGSYPLRLEEIITI